MQPAREVRVPPVVDPVGRDREHGGREELVAEGVGEGDRGAAEEVAARGDAHVDRRPALEVEPLEEVLAPLVLRHDLVGDVGLEVHEALGRGPDVLLDLLHRLRRVLRVELVLALVVGHEREAVAARGLQRGRGHRAAEHVGVLRDRAGAEVEAPQVRDVLVLVRGVVDLRPVGREVGRLVVERPEGQLGLLRRVGEGEGVELPVAADPPLVDDGLPVRRHLRVVVGVLVVRQVRDGARLEVEPPDVGDALLQGLEEHRAPVGQDARGLHLVERNAHLLADRAVEHREQEEAAALAGAPEEADVVALRIEGERAAGHELAVDREALPRAVEAAREVLDDVPVLRRDEHDVGLALVAVRRHDGGDLAGGGRREGERLGEARLLGVGREVAAEVVGPLLVAIGLEALLQPLVERRVELLRRRAEGLLVELLGAAAENALAQRVEELPDPLLAVAGLHELEARVAHVVDEPAGEGLELHPRQLRHVVGEGRVADHHEVERVPGTPEVVGEALVDPQGDAPLRDAEAHAARDEVERERVDHLVGDEALHPVGRLVDRDHHAVLHRLGERLDALGDERGVEVRLLELGVGLVEDHRDRLRHLVLEAGRDLQVAALEVRRQAGEVLLELRVVEHLEVRALVDAPREVVVLDLVLPEVRDELRRGGPRRQDDGEREGGEGGEAAEASHGAPIGGERGSRGSSAA